jgi:hypothetical protein
VLRAIAHLGVVLLLVAALVSGALACAPAKGGGCCDRAGHCKRVSKTCDNQPVAVLTSLPPAIAMPAAAAEPVPAPQAELSSPVIPVAQDSPPDLCLLYSIFRI